MLERIDTEASADVICVVVCSCLNVLILVLKGKEAVQCACAQPYLAQSMAAP